MILRLSFEEITALNSAAQRLLESSGEGSVLAPPEAMAELESRLPLGGDISVRTLPEQFRLSGAVAMILDELKRRMDAFVIDQYAVIVEQGSWKHGRPTGCGSRFRTARPCANGAVRR